jgi:AcrR family transcriptional regulator
MRAARRSNRNTGHRRGLLGPDQDVRILEDCFVAETRRTQAERSATTRSALVDAARHLFATKGYTRANREEIVAAAGVTRGALQHHFGDKESLFLAVYESVEQDVVEQVAKAAMKAGDDPLDHLRAGCHAYLDAVMDPAVRRICAIDGPAVLAAETRQQITDRYALGVVREALETAVEKGRIDRAPVDALARVLLAGITEAALYVATSSDLPGARADAGRTLDLLLEGLER